MEHFSFFFFILSTAALTAADLEGLKKANNLFASNVYLECAKKEAGNFLISPFSAETVLAFLQSGAKDATAEELRTALHLPNNKSQVELSFKSLLSEMRESESFTFQTANKIYVKENFHIKDEFKNIASLVYDADSEAIDFGKKEEAAKTMNSWVEQHTNNKIKNLVKSNELGEDTKAVLINALYFKSNWMNQFKFSVRKTKKNIFYKTATETVEVDTMHLQHSFKYYNSQDLSAEFLQLPFEWMDATMFIVLPYDVHDPKKGLANLEKQLDQVLSPEHELDLELMDVAIPKFKIESEIDFKNILQNLGVSKAFDSNQADLSGISGNPGDLAISKITQKTFIDVNEEGVEAAASTSLSFRGSSFRPNDPKFFRADRPFIFYIKVKDIVVFAGRVTDPSKH